MNSRLAILAAATLCMASVTPVGVAGSSSQDAAIALSVDESSVWVGESVVATVTIDNSRFGPRKIDSIRVVDATGTALAEGKPDESYIGPSESQQVVIGVPVGDAGVTELVAAVEFEDGYEESQQSVAVTARDPTPLVDITATGGTVPTERTLQLTIGNPLNESITRVEATLLGPDSANVTDNSGILPTIQTGEKRKLNFDVRGVEPGRADFYVDLSFATADGRVWNRSVSNTVTFEDSRVRVSPSTAPVRLAGLDITGGGEVAISGDVANAQSTALTGVLITFPDDVEATGNRFVGSVNGGEFAPFNPISTSIPSNRTTVPVEVSYTLDGTRYVTVFELPIEGVSEESAIQDPDFDDSSRSGTSAGPSEEGLPIPVVGIGAGVALLAVLLVGIVYKRR